MNLEETQELPADADYFGALFRGLQAADLRLESYDELEERLIDAERDRDEYRDHAWLMGCVAVGLVAALMWAAHRPAPAPCVAPTGVMQLDPTVIRARPGPVYEL